MKKAIAVAAIVLSLAGCATTNYKEFVGGHPVSGPGGTREMVNGVEVWEDGAPERTFKVIGIINDTRPGGVIYRMNRISDVAQKAKEQHGDGVIIYSEGSQIAGVIANSYSTTNTYGNHASTTSSGVAVPVVRLDTKAAVFVYVQ